MSDIILALSGSALQAFNEAEERTENFLSAAAGHHQLSAEQLQLMAADGDSEEEQSRLLTLANNIAIITIKGMLTNTNRYWNRWYGLISYDEIRQAIIQALDAGAGAILFHYGTPGGRVAGMSDLADFISNLDIPTVSFTDEGMASAGYFLGSQSDYVFGDRFANIGSIGVIINFLVLAGALKEQKIEPYRFRTGELKQPGNPYFKPTQQEKNFLQEQVDITGELFYQMVSESRGIPRNMMESLGITSGKEFIGQQALDVGLIDGLMTFDQSVAKTMQLAQKNLDTMGSREVVFR